MSFTRQFVGRHNFVHTYYAIFAVFALKKLWKTYYYASAYDLSNFSILETSQKDCSYYDLLSAYCYSVNNLKIFIGGINETREDKLRIISDSDIVKKYLHVCVRTFPRNCNICFKCRRTILELDMINRLNEFRDVFDIDYYKKNKLFYLRHLVIKSENYFNKPIYEYFLNKEPELIAKVKQDIIKNKKYARASALPNIKSN